jgi:two-component system LytT family response regulator
MKAVIIEDEKRNSTQLRSLLAKNCPHVAVIGEGADADSGRNLIKALQPDLVFLDIQLPGKSGFDMLSELGSCSFEVIFVSGFDSYGIQAIKFSALDYLLKPVKPKELVEAVRKAESSSSKKQAAEKITNLLSHLEQTDITDKRIGLPLMKEIRFVNIADVMHCESENSYTKFYMNDGEILVVSSGLFAYDAQLKPYHFLRCHQSHLVNRKYIKSLLKEDTVSELVLTDGTRIPVSRLKRDLIKDELRLR